MQIDFFSFRSYFPKIKRMERGGLDLKFYQHFSYLMECNSELVSMCCIEMEVTRNVRSAPVLRLIWKSTLSRMGKRGESYKNEDQFFKGKKYISVLNNFFAFIYAFRQRYRISNLKWKPFHVDIDFAFTSFIVFVTCRDKGGIGVHFIIFVHF